MCTCTPREQASTERKVSASRSLATTPRAAPWLRPGTGSRDPRPGGTVSKVAYSYAFRDPPRCLKKPWKREHRREYMHERANCRSKFPEQTRPVRLTRGESADIIRLISEEMVRGAGKEDGELKRPFVNLSSGFAPRRE